jgi:hypothetical protein
MNDIQSRRLHKCTDTHTDITHDSPLGDFHTTLEPIDESSLSTTTSMDLGLDHQLLCTSFEQILRNLLSLLRGVGNLSALHTHVELVHEVLALVLVQVKVANWVVDQRLTSAGHGRLERCQQTE